MAPKICTALVLVALCAGACDEPELAPLPVGSFVDFASEDLTVSFCAGTPARLDRHVERVLDFLGEPVPMDLLVPVRILEEPPCRNTSCYRARAATIYSAVLDPSGRWPGGVVEHELTHALSFHAWGGSIPALLEGLADALTSSFWDQPATGAPIQVLLSQAGGEFESYAELGRFVRFLIDTRGLEKFKQLYQATQDRSLAAIKANFIDVYGEDLDAIEAQYVSGPSRCRYQLDACDLSSAEPVSKSWSETFAASCLDPDFHGSRAGEREAFATHRTLRIDDPGRYQISISLSSVPNFLGVPITPQALFVRCGDCEEQQIREIFGDDELTLAAGVYSLLLRPAGDSIGTVQVQFVGATPP